MKPVAKIILFSAISLAVVFTVGAETRLPGTSAPHLQEADAWCPTGKDLDEYLEARSLLPWKSMADPLVDFPGPPVVIPQDGVLIIEDTGRILQNDRVLDLPMESIELIPSGDGYQVSFIPPAYEPLGQKDNPLFTGQTEWTSRLYSLRRFTFPFGGQERTDLWVTPANLIAFAQPSQPFKVGLCSTGCYMNEGQVLLNRLPRISPLHHGSFFYGLNGFLREERDHVVITWKYDAPENLDIQAVLFDDGRIRFNYNAVSGIPWGAPLVVTGNDAFWSDLRLGGDVTDPAGEVPIPAPNGPGMDLVGASARQVGTSELLHVEFTLAEAPSAAMEGRVIYRVEMRDNAYDPEPVGSILLQWQNGQFYWMTEPVALNGSTVEMNIRLFDLPLTDDNVHFTFITYLADAPFTEGDRVTLTATFDPATGPLMLDLDTELPVTTGNEPLYEAFTLPALQIGEVLKVTAPLFEDPSAVEAFPIYQNLWTDIWFFAGAYHGGGNAGADGIGSGSSSMPRSPSLLHMNHIANYDVEEWAMAVLSHEFGHRWLYHFAIEENGEPSRILNPAGSHPAGWVHTPAVTPVYKPLDFSVMGGSWWTDNGNGTFSSPPEIDGNYNGYSWHEMYLLGLAAPEEVPDWWYIDNAMPSLPNAYWAPADTTVLGDRVPVSLDQLIAVEGERFPPYPDSPDFFLNPMVLVVRPGEYVQADLDTVNNLCDLWEIRFGQATNSRAGLRCRFSPPVVDIITPTLDISINASDLVVFEGTGTDADGDGVTLRWDFSGAATGTTGPGPHTVTFAYTGSYPVELSGVDDSGMFAASTDTVLVTVDCPTTFPPDPVAGLRIGKEAGGFRFTWTDLAIAPANYVVLSSDSPEGPFRVQGEANSGVAGLSLPDPGGNLFYKVAARNDPGCIGPY